METINKVDDLFPTKQSMLGKLSYKKIDVVSNHFQIKFSDKTAFDEWSLSFYDQKHKNELLNLSPKDLAARASNLESSVPADSTILIAEVITANKDKLLKQFGDYFWHGSSLYTLSKAKSTNPVFVFTNHPCHLLKADRKHSKLSPATIERTKGISTKNNLIRFLNSYVKNCLKRLDYGTWGRQLKYYHMEDYNYITNYDLYIYKGCLSSIGLYEGGLRMIVDYSTRIIRGSDMWTEFLNSEISEYDIEGQKEFFVGKTVVANYGNYRMYQIHDVDFNKNLQSPFPNKEFKTYEAYYRKKYPSASKFMYKDQFLLIHRRRTSERGEDGRNIYEKIYLVPELLSPTGLTEDMKNNFRLMKEVAVNTAIKPQKRFNYYQDLIDKINKEAKGTSINMTIDKNSNKIKAYCLKAPTVLNKRNENVVKGDKINVRDIIKPKTFSNWVFITCGYTQEDAEQVRIGLKKAASFLKIKMDNPVVLNIKKNILTNELSDLLKKKKASNPDIVFVLCKKSFSKGLYKRLKKYFTRKGIPSQFLVKFNSNKNQTQGIFSSIVNQMVVKLGGNLWDIKFDLKDTIIAGADVYHGPKNNSVASLVVQAGENFNEFYSTPKIQKKGKELITGMATLVLDSIEHFRIKHKKLAKNFVFFRDGVGEGQIEAIERYEIKTIVDGLKKSYGSNAPKLLFVIVTKRIDDRFGVKYQNETKNPEGGLLVLDDVVKKDRANFYLVAQKVNQGTATPTHYEVIYNSTDIKLEKLIDLAYSFTFGYSNWSGAVKVPAPVQYAHKQAALHGVTQDDHVSEKLKSIRHFM